MVQHKEKSFHHLEGSAKKEAGSRTSWACVGSAISLKSLVRRALLRTEKQVEGIRTRSQALPLPGCTLTTATEMWPELMDRGAFTSAGRWWGEDPGRPRLQSGAVLLALALDCHGKA